MGSWRNNISAQLVKSIFGLYFIVALVVTIAQIGLEFKNVRKSIIGQLKGLETSFGPALSTSLWEQNDLAISAILKGVVKNDYVNGMKILDEFGEQVNFEGKIIEGSKNDTKLDKNTSWLDKLFWYEFPLTFVRNKKTTKVGNISIYSSNRIVFDRIKYSLVLIVINSIIKTSVLWLIMLFFINKFLERPLDKLKEEVQNIDFDKIKGIDQVSPNKNQLSTFVDSFNDLLFRLSGYRSEVLKYQSELEDKVKDRTKDLKDAIKEVEAANRVKDQFLANISHEIRTPLNGILGFSDILESKKELSNDERTYYTSELKSSAKNLLKLINNIIDLSKVGSDNLEIKPHNFSLKALGDDVVSMFSSQAKEKGINLSYNYSDDLPNIFILDENRLRQVLFNIIHNSFKFTKRGDVTLSISGVINNSKNYDLEIKISDTGIGIPTKQLDKIFETFVQKDGQSINEYGGVGLGLSLSRGIVELMGGRIVVSSEEEVGSTFTIMIPNVEANDLTSDTDIKKYIDYKKVHFNQTKILIVEDIKINRDVIEGFLIDQNNLEIHMAMDGDEGVEKAMDLKPDIILMDISLPKKDGITASREILAMGFETKILAITASIDEHTLGEDIKFFDEFILKPISKEELVLSLAKYIEFSEKDNGVEEENSLNIEEYFEEPIIDDESEFLRQITSLIKTLRAAQRSMTLNDLEDLSKRADSFSQMVKWLPLKEVCNELKEALTKFEMDKIPNILKKINPLLMKYSAHKAA